MTLYDEIVKAYPELINSDLFADGTIVLQNDGDEMGDYVAVWNYEKPLPKGIKLGK